MLMQHRTQLPLQRMRELHYHSASFSLLTLTLRSCHMYKLQIEICWRIRFNCNAVMLRLLHMTDILTLHALKMHYALLLLLQAARGLGRGKDFTFVTSDVAELVPVVKHMQQVCLALSLSILHIA
jgi:hypothetical protein